MPRRRPESMGEIRDDGDRPASVERLSVPDEPAGPQQPPPEPRSSVPPSVSVGDVLDERYRLLHALKEGGMGTLFVAHNAVLDVRVAIKLIRRFEHDEGGEAAEQRLLQEARAAAALRHPAIVRVFDFGRTPRGEPYIVMELLQGEDLCAALDRRGRIEPIKAVRALLPIAQALATAHEHGIVHRDVKPANIFLARTEEGELQPKLIDFGVAKLHRPQTERLTWVGAALGTPEYMSPELAGGDDVDASADSWALCAVLYEMVTGELPFNGKNLLALLRAIVEQEPQPIADRGLADPELWAILHKGFDKQRERRWQSMRELGQALASLLLARGIQHDVCGTQLQAAWLEERSIDERIDVFSSVPPVSTSGDPAPVVLIPRLGGPPDARSLAATEPSLLPAPAAGLPKGQRSAPVSPPRGPVSEAATAEDAAAPDPRDGASQEDLRRTVLLGYLIVAAAIVLVGALAIAAWLWATTRPLPAPEPAGWNHGAAQLSERAERG